MRNINNRDPRVHINACIARNKEKKYSKCSHCNRDMLLRQHQVTWNKLPPEIQYDKINGCPTGYPYSNNKCIKKPIYDFSYTYHTVDPNNIDEHGTEQLTYGKMDNTIYDLSCVENRAKNNSYNNNNNNNNNNIDYSTPLLYMGFSNKPTKIMSRANGYTTRTSEDRCPPGYTYENIYNPGLKRHFRKCTLYCSKGCSSNLVNVEKMTNSLGINKLKNMANNSIDKVKSMSEKYILKK